MKLLLLLPVCAFCISFEELVRQVQEKERYGKISDVIKAKLLKTWGTDPEVRRVRLERIAKKAAEQLKKEEVPIKENIYVIHQHSPIFVQNIPRVEIDKPYEGAPADLFELNNRLGVSKYLFQGDINLTEEQLKQLEMEVNENGRNKRQAYAGASRWTNNTVYFYFDSDINDSKKNTVYAAHKYIQSQTCINFVEDRMAKNRIRVHNGIGMGCQSRIGMIGGEQDLSLEDGCDFVGVAGHEFAHALGFFHVQMRSDRDEYVTIYEKNIKDKMEGNFEKLHSLQNILYVPYEYGSFMQYSVDSFSKEKNAFTMVPKDERYFFTMGNSQISFYDMKMINEFYKCTANCPLQSSATCENGGYPNPRNCSKCNCPAGYGGDLCNERPSGCGETFTATSEWQKGVIEVGDRSNPGTTRTDFSTCNHWIMAPEDKKIEVKITEMLNGQCNYGCQFNGIEIKTESNKQIRNPLICCDEFTNKTFISALNPTPIISFNSYYASLFTIAYRYVDEASSQPPAVTTSASVTRTDSSTTESITTSTSTTSTSPLTVKTETAATMTTRAPCMDILGDSCSTYVEHMGGCKKIEEFERKFCARTCGYCKKRTCPKHKYMKDGKCVKDDRYDVHLA